MAATLTKLSVEAARPDTDGRREIPDGALPGFYLIVQPSGKKSWAVRYRIAGKPKKMTIGPYPRLDLSEARVAARQALKEVSERNDPAVMKAAAKEEELSFSTYSFSKVAADFIDKYAKRRNRTWAETERLLAK